MSRESFCQYAPSCDQQWLNLPDPTVVQINGTTKTVTCPGGLQLDLLYLYDPVAKTCTYTLDTGVAYAGQVRIQIASVPAAEIWNHTTTDIMRTDPQVTVTGDTPLCSFIKSVATFQCFAPFVAVADNLALPNTTSEFCTEASVVTVNCGSQLVQCRLDATLVSYTCISFVSSGIEPSFIQPFAMQCSAVSPSVVGAMVNSASGCNTMGRNCLSNIASRDLAAQLQGSFYMAGSFDSDFFTCMLPFYGPFNVTELCELLPTNQQVTITCFAQQLVCFSPVSRTSDHTCRYQGGFLNLFCGIPQGDAGPLLNESYILQDLANEPPIRRRRLLALQEEEEDDKDNDGALEPEQVRLHAPRRPVMLLQLQVLHLTNTSRVHIPGHGWVNRTHGHAELLVEHHRMLQRAVVYVHPPSSLLQIGGVRAINAHSLVPHANWVKPKTIVMGTVQRQKRHVALLRHNRHLLALTPDQAAEQIAQNERVCNYLLGTCGTSLNCTTDSLPPALADDRMSRGTYCTSPIPTSCHGFNQLPVTPITSTPQFVAADNLTVAIQCRKTVTGNDVTYHNIVCNLVPQYTASECWYFCSAREAFIMTVSAFPVPANVLLAANYTASQRCFEVMGVAESAPVPITIGSDVTPTTLTIPNFFSCSPPYVTTAQDICVHTPDQLDEYTKTCGVMTIVCSVVPTTFVYQCNSTSTVPPYLISTPNVPLTVAAPSVLLTPLQQCLALRDTYAQTYSCPDLRPDLVLTDTASVFCNIVLNATQMIASPPGFDCGTTTVNCTLNPSNLTYTCTAPAATSYLDMFCPDIDPYLLLVTLNVGQLPENAAFEAQPAFQLQRCLTVKQLCLQQVAALNATFDCNPQYLQNSALGQFCDARAPDPPFNTTLTCGVDPVHTVFCTNRDNLTAIHDWLRCTGDDGDAYLSLDCQVERSVFDNQLALAANASALHPDEWVCDLLRVLCPIPVTCDPGVPPGYCPAPSAPAIFDCAFPAQACDGYFCQLSAADRNDVPADLDGTQNVGVCRFEPEEINVTCSGFPITCRRQSVFAANTTDVADIQYNCTHPYASPQGFLSTGRDMQLGCLVPRIDLDFSAQPFHTCLRIGLQCLAISGGIECSQNYMTSLDAPFCSLPANPADVGGVFLCNGLVVTCVPSADINRVQCSSLASSRIWVLGANRNSVDFPTPPSTAGCVLAPRDFYLNPAERCSILFTTCLHSCSTGFNTAPGANATGPNFCQEFTGNTLDFTCDGQPISCAPVPLPDESSATLSPSDLNAYMVDADLDRHRQQLQCTSPSSSTSLSLECLVNRFLFMQRPDACSTLLSQCLTNMGTFECAAPYVSTPAAPFCTTTLVPTDTPADCNCGLWWSRGNREGVQQIPYPLVDLSCYASLLLDSDDLAACRATQATTAVGDGITCARRGYVSMEQYLLFVHGPALFPTAAEQLFAQHPEQVYWCLFSLDTPSLACAVQPGMGLQLCTIECPEGLRRTSIRGSTTEYCCRDPGACTLDADSRNCVLGRHDANATAYFALVPNQTCPDNLFNAYSTFPLVTTIAAGSEAAQWAQPRQLCSTAPGRCYGFSVLFNLRLGTRALYFLNRPPAFTDERVQKQLDPQRLVSADREARYHLHTVPQSLWPQSATRLFNDPNTWSHQVTTFFLERAHGYDCPDERLQWVDYVLGSADAKYRVADRVNEFLVGLGAGPQLLQSLYLPAIGADILTSQLHNVQQLVDGSYVLINAPFLVLTPQIEAIRDILHMLSVDNVLPALQQQDFNATRGNLTRPFAGSPAVLSELISQEFVQLHHPAYDSVVGMLPLFGTLAGDMRRVVRLHEFVHGVSFVSVETGTAGPTTDLVKVGWLDLPDRVTQIRFATFADLYAWFAHHDWELYGSQIPGTGSSSRPEPNSRCHLQTLPWADAQCSVPQDGCLLPVDPTWDWGADDQQQQQQQQREGSGGVAPITPNPAEADVQHDTNGIPCGDGKGLCVPSGTTPAFKCVCFAPFAVQTGMLNAILVNGVPVIPLSLRAGRCDLDLRDRCTSVARGISTVCSNRGQCVVAFVANRQTAVCQCGNFPIDTSSASPSLPGDRTCNEVTPRTCELHQLPWIAGGFEEASVVGQNLCRVPRLGCRSALQWSRSGGNAFERGDTDGCEVPRGNLLLMPPTGSCLPVNPLPSTLDPFFQTDAALDTWQCACNPGRYGQTCQYVALNGACYSTDVERLLARSGTNTETAETWCIWNAHLIQWEVEDESNIPVDDRFGSLPRALCRGLVCSGHGVCSHVGENNAGGLEEFSDPNDATFQYGQPGLVSPTEQAFVAAALQRVLAQNCSCSPGWTGRFCEQPTCLGGCGPFGVCQVPAAAFSDSRIQPFCACPMRRRDRRVLVQGATCQGLVCGGRGQLVVLQGGSDFDCQCTPPFYQGPRTASLCSLVCPGDLITQPTVGGRTVTLCVCTNAVGVEMLCSDLLLQADAELALNISSMFKFVNATLTNFTDETEAASTAEAALSSSSSSSTAAAADEQWTGLPIGTLSIYTTTSSSSYNVGVIIGVAVALGLVMLGVTAVAALDRTKRSVKS